MLTSTLTCCPSAGRARTPQPRALVLDCAYRPINVVTWYKAFHFDYFGKVGAQRPSYCWGYTLSVAAQVMATSPLLQ